MAMLNAFIKKVFGTKHERQMKRMQPLIDRINGLESKMKGLAEADAPMLKTIEGLGVKVTQLTAGEREAFVKATRPTYDNWKKQIGAPLVTRAEEAVAKR